MRGLANPDSKIYGLLNRFAMLIELNLLVLLCCLPVVTAGAALCSMHSVLLKIYRGEEKRIISDFFEAMKSNLKNGTILWLLFGFYVLVLVGIWNMAAALIPENAVSVLLGLLVAGVLGAMYLDWALILQSRYVYTIPQCLKYALLAWMKYPGSTFVYLISIVIPALFCFSLETLILAVFSVGLAHLISTTLYSRVFDQMEGVPPRVHKL